MEQATSASTSLPDLSRFSMSFYKASLEEYLDGLEPGLRRKIWNEQLADCVGGRHVSEDWSDDEVS
jgi:hypothetical protein